MNQQNTFFNYENLFTQIHPDFFAPGKLDFMDEDIVYEEMILSSENTEYEKVQISVPQDVVFKFVNTSDNAEMEKVQLAVESVDKEWLQYFKSIDSRIFCGYIGNEIASFCLIDEFGIYDCNGKALKIGGPGCVGTVPVYRRKGIGLKMVQNATKILFDQGYDLSWIHWTGVGPWYGKLGYKTVLKWNKTGIIEK